VNDFVGGERGPRAERVLVGRISTEFAKGLFRFESSVEIVVGASLVVFDVFFEISNFSDEVRDDESEDEDGEKVDETVGEEFRGHGWESFGDGLCSGEVG
jgi:hypothetical protein